MGMKADGNLYIAAQFLDTFDEIGKQVEKGAAKISKNTKIDLSIDEKNILKDIDKLVGSVKFKDLDLSDVISSVFASISKEGMSNKDRTKILDNFQTSLQMFHTAPLKDLKQLKGAKSEDLTSIIQEIETDFFSDSSKRKWTSATLKGNVKDIIAEKLRGTVTDTVGSIQQTLIQEFGENIAKYGVDAKTAKNKLKAIYEKAFNEKGEMDVFGLTDNDFTSTSQKMKDFRGYYQRLNKLKEEIPEEFEELFLAIGDYLDDFENDENTEKAVKDWIESIFQLEDKVIDYANREEALNKELANKIEAKNQQQKENKSPTKQTVKPKFDTDVETKKNSSEGSEVKKKVETKNTQNQNTTVEVEKQKTTEIEKQNQVTQDLLEKAKEVNKTESEITEEKKEQTQETKNSFQLFTEKRKKKREENSKLNSFELDVEESIKADYEAELKDISEILKESYTEKNKTKLYNQLKQQKKISDNEQALYSNVVKEGGNFEEVLKTSDIERLRFLKIAKQYRDEGGSLKRLRSVEDELTGDVVIEDEIEDIEGRLNQRIEQLNKRIQNRTKRINQLKGGQNLSESESINPVDLIQETTNNEENTIQAQQERTQEIKKQNELLEEQKQKTIDISNTEKEINNSTLQKSKKDTSSQIEVENQIQNTTSTNQEAIESNKQLAESVQEVTQAVQQEEQVFSNAEKQIERNNSILYHYGDYSKNKPSHQFGDEKRAWFSGIDNQGVGYADGTGTYVSNHIDEYSPDRISDKILTKFYSIDVSKLNLYEAHTEEQAEIFHKFIHQLEQYCIMIGSGFEGFADNLKNVDAQSLYSDFKKVFPSIEMSFEEFNDFISRMRNLVIESGMNKNGEINPQKLFEFKKNNGIDDIKTRFLKELGYHGTNLSGTSYGGLRNGSVLFDDNARLFTVTSGKLLSDVAQEAEEIINTQSNILQKHNIKISGEDLIGASSTELEQIRNLLKEIYDNEIRLQNVKSGSRIESSIKEKINEAKTKVEEIKNNISSKKENNIIQNNLDNQLVGQEQELTQVQKGKLDITKKELQTEQQLTNELKEQSNIEQTSKNISQENKKEFELQTIKEIKEETQQVAEQQQKITEAKEETLQAAQQELKAEQQLSIETQKQESSEEKKPKITLVHNGKKLPSVEKHGKSQAEINAQLKEDRKKRNARTPRTTEAADIENQEAKKVFEEDKVKDEAEIKANEQYLEELRQKYLEAKKAKEEAIKPEKQQIEASSEQIQKITSGVENAVKALKEYKAVSDRITEAQNNKEGFKPSEETTQEMLQAGAFSSYGEMGRYIQSAYRTYKKTGATQDEKILQEALRVFMSYVEKDESTGQFIHRDNSYLFSKKNNKGEYKEIKTYANDKKYKEYISQAEKENASFEDALVNLSFLEGDREDKQKAYVAATLQLKQLLQEVGLESETINEILASINGNLTNEEAIWEVLNSYIKEATQELIQQEVQTENISSDNVVDQEEKKQEAIQETIDKVEELNTALAEEPPSSTKIDTNIELSEPKKQPEKPQESILTTTTENSIKAINEESNSLKEVKNTANQAAKAKESFVSANKKVKQSAEKSTPSIKKEANALEKAKQKAETEKEKEQKRILTQNGAIVDDRAKLARETEKKLEKGSYDKEIQKFRNIISQYSPSESRSAADAIDLASKSINGYEAKINELKAVASGDLQLDKPFEELVKEINNAQEAADVFVTDVQTNFSKVANSNSVKDLKTKIDSIVDTYQRISSDNKNKLKDIGESLIGGQTTQKQLADVRSQMKEILAFEKSEGNLDTGIWGRMVGKMQEGVAFLATKFSFYQIFNQFRQGFEVIHQFDDALTEMMKVSDETRLSLERYQKTTFETADAIGTSALQIQQSTADFMRLGETLNQAAESAKAANILMNVSEFSSIDEATKSLIAMGAAYDDLSKMNIIDKLNQVGNNFAISTSEAATALQASASALTTANNDMDEALALITAGNAVVQDATKVGTGMRTIALRLTGTKSAKEELEEMGEETENVITTQSKLRDVIKEATAVASNEYKGFDILDDNGNYKSTYEIMLGIAEVYDEILETDKKFGRNNANLLLENVAGKVRANIAASIFQNPELLKEAYASSQSADNSAMRENEKYMQSISGHLAQLKNAWQEVWANAANRDVINFFIDLGTAVLKFVNTIGVLPTTFALLLPYLEMFKRGKDGKGLISSFLEWANGLNEVEKIVKELGEAEVASDVASTASSAMKTAANQAETASALEQAEAYEYVNYTEALESTTDLEGVITSTAKSAANMTEQFSETGKEATKTTSKLGLLGGAFKGLASAIGLPTLAFAGFVAACLIAKKAYDAYNEARFNEAKQATDSIKQQQDSMSAQIESYKELKAQLDSGDLSEQETIETKQKILDIQKQISNEYGSAAKGVDLVNGKLEKQVDILNSITEKDADRQYGKNYEGFQVASREYRRERNYNVKLNNSNNSQLNKAMRDIYEEVGMKPVSAGMGTFNANVKKNAIDSIKVLEEARDSLEDLKKEYRDPIDVKAIDKQIAEIESEIGRAYETVDKYEETALKGMELELARNQRFGYNAYQNYQTSTSDLESAYASGNTKKIEEARKAFDEANEAKNRFLKIEGNEQFALLFDSINTSLVETKNKAYDAVQDLKIASQINEEILSYEEKAKSDETAQNHIKDLKDETKATGKYTKENKKLAKALKQVTDLNMDRVDAELVFDKNAISSEAYSDALHNLMDAIGWTVDDANLLIDTLVDAGYIQGNLSDAVDAASVSYNEYASAVSTATENLSTLQNVLTESDSGKGLTSTTLDQFKQAFGDDAVKALENTANGIRVNRDAIRELGEQQNESLRTTHLEALNAQYTALQKVYEGYENALKNGDPTTPFIQQEKAIRDEIANLELLEAQWRGTSSAYQQWLNSQSSSKPQDMYSNIVSGYETVEDLIARGWWSDPTVRDYLDLVLEDDFDAQAASADELKERFEGLDKTIEGTKFSLHDFFMTDESGKIAVDGLNNFEDALKQIQDKYYPDKNWLTYDEDGNAIFDFTNGGNKEVADALGMGTELLDVFISAMESAGGFEIKLDTDDANKNLDELKQAAVEAKDSLNLNEKINLDPTSVEEADKSINNLSQVITSLQDDNTIDLETKTDKLEKANKILEYLVENKNQLVQKQFTNGEIHLIDIDELEAADKKIEKIMNRPIKDGFDFSNFDLDSIEGLESAKNTISSMINNMSLSPDVDDSKVQYLNELLDAIQVKLDIINGAGTNGAELTLGEYKALDETVTSVKQQIEEGQAAAQKGFHISWSSDTEFFETLDKLNNLDSEIKAAFGLIPDKTTEELMDMVENGETIFIETKTKGVTPPPVQDETRTINTQENVTLGVTTVGVDPAKEIIQEFEEKNGTESTIVLNAESNVEEVQQGLQETQEESKQLDAERPDVTATLDDKATGPLNSLRNLITDTDGMSATVFSHYKDPDNAHYEISYIDSHVYDRKQTITTEYKTIGSPSGMGGVNGTAHAFGTAFTKGSINAYDKGDWGVSEDQTALVGELGTELLVRNGKWYDIGGQGAEFVNLKKGDIIFNSRQRDELFANGYVTSNGGRGRMIGGSSFAMGSIVSGGNAFANEAKRTRTTSSVKTKKAGSKNSTTSKSGGGSNGGGNGSHGGGSDNKSADKAKETKNTLDEVEILIARIERQISRLDSTIGNTYTKWATRNSAIKRNLSKVTEEIQDQKDAYNTYMNKANSIGLPDKWVKIIQNGQQAIEDVIEQAKESGDTSDTLWDKITKYREYYEKALAALDKVQELEQKEGELYKQRFDNEQTYYEAMVENLQHTIDLMGAYNDQLEESGKLTSRNYIIKQISIEQAKIKKLEGEYKILTNRRDEAVKSGKIKKYSEAWYEMQNAINEVKQSIVEANTELITFRNNFREVNWNRWDKIHDAISGVTNEIEFLYDLIDEDKMFDDTGVITNEGIAAFGLLTQEYDTYFAEVERYRQEIAVTKKELDEDPYNQNLIDKLKEQIEGQQDAVSSAKKMKDAMIDVAEKGIKKQIDYVKDLIEDYEELLETQKDQTEYAKKVADQQKEINKLEKQYRAIQNDTSEEGQTKRQKLKNQIDEKKQELQETQEDRRISETKDMLGKFEESFEDFLENKLKDVEGIIKEGISGINNNTAVVKDTIEELAHSYGYTLSGTLQSTLSDLSNNLASYFDSAFDNKNVKSITNGVNAIVNFYNKSQKESNRIAMATKVQESGSHMQAYVDENGVTKVGYFRNDGIQLKNYTGNAKNGDKTYRFENGTKTTKSGWINENGKKYYLNKDSSYATGFNTINGKKYYFNSKGEMQTAWQTINGKKYHFNRETGVMHTGLVTIGKNKYYFDKNGVLQMGKWQTINGKQYYLSKDGHILTGKQTINGEKYTFYKDGVLMKKGWKKGTASVPKTGYNWTNEGRKPEAIIRKSDGAILTPLNRGDSVIPNSAMKNMYKALTDPEKYLKQYTTSDIKILQTNTPNSSSTPPVFNMQFIANGVQDANKFVNDLMNNRKLEKWIQEVTLGQANGNNSFRKYSYAVR